MYCWIEPRCGCSICIGPPGKNSLPDPGLVEGSGSGGQTLGRSSPAPILHPARLSQNLKMGKTSLEGYLPIPLSCSPLNFHPAAFSQSPHHRPERNPRKPPSLRTQDREALQPGSWLQCKCTVSLTFLRSTNRGFPAIRASKWCILPKLSRRLNNCRQTKSVQSSSDVEIISP